MPQLGQLTGLVARGRASFHADQTRRHRREEGQHLRAAQPLASHDLAGLTNGMHLEDVFGQIQADCGNLHGGRSLSLWRSSR